MNGSLRSLQIFTGILKRSKLGASEVFGVAEPHSINCGIPGTPGNGPWLLCSPHFAFRTLCKKDVRLSIMLRTSQ